MLLPIRAVTRPAMLAGLTNGRLPDSALWNTPGLAGGPTIRLVPPATRGWRAMTAAASAAGHTLKATSAADSYRRYEVQERVWRQRCTTTPIAGVQPRWWQGQWWYLRPGYAPVAIPGTSNHGDGLAVDCGEERDADTGTESMDAVTLAWLAANELDFGWSHELQVEPWHIRFWAGDQIPAAVLQHEKEISMRTVLLAKDHTGQIWAGNGVNRRPVAPASLPGLLWTLSMAGRFGQPAIAAASIETYDDITVLGEPVLTAAALVDALVASLPAGTLTRAEVEAAVRAAFAPGLHLPLVTVESP